MNRTAAVISAVLILGMTIAGIWVLTRIPAAAMVPIHYNQQGPSKWVPTWVAVFLLPAIASGLWIFYAVAPRITPRGENLLKSPMAYGTLWVATTTYLTLLDGRLLANALSHGSKISAYVLVIVGGFFIVTGNVMGKLRWNYVVGIRNPWTFFDERVWDKAQRFGGWAFVTGGIVIVAAAFFPMDLSHVWFRNYDYDLVLGVVLAMVFATLIRSYFLWRAQKNIDANPAGNGRG